MPGLKKKKLHSGVKIVIVIVMVIVAANIFRYFQFHHSLVNRASNSFQSNREEIQLVTDYLLETGFRSIVIFIRPSEISTYGAIELRVRQERIPVSDDRVSDAIRHLSQNGYQSIRMR